MRLYTIGFTQKSAQQFFTLLADNNVRLLVDIRVSPGGQLAGFTRKADMPYFLRRLANGCAYWHEPLLAPTKEILSAYRAGESWTNYVTRFEALMDARAIPHALDRARFAEEACCLLCSEATPEQCHRRLVAERLARVWGDVEIIHL